MLMATAMQAQDVIDMHAHIITPSFLSDLKAHDALLDEGFPIPQYDVERHLQWMDEAGVQTSVLTLAAPQPFDAKTVRETNEEAARLKREHPGRFLFCAALPLPDVEAAMREAVYALDTLGADGIKLASNVRGQYLGAPELDPLMALLSERRAVVIIHPHRPEPVNREVMLQTPLAMQEYLGETTRAVANMISRNVLAHYPGMKVVVPHCGAYLPLAVPRMKSLTPVMQANHLVGDIDWEANLAALYYDLAGAHSAEVIRMMLSITTPDHLLYGSDYPYVAPQVLTAGLARMRKYLAEEPDLAPFGQMILHKNARRLFALDGAHAHADASPNADASNATEVERTAPLATQALLVRLAEIEVYPEYLAEYLAQGREIAATSVRQEPGVLCLFPMQSKEDSTQVRILEIYASQEAYQRHIATDHFLRYKQGTMHMVKSLKLSDMRPLDPETMKLLFKKLF